ncbi:MAG: YbaB/EbfC family nucleoid-associated protein [Patescibacteria group bacterium]|mgnify:FL=1
MFNKIKQIKDLRSQAKTIQSALAEIQLEGSASWGKVVVKMNGNQEVLDVRIDDELLSQKTKLQEAIREATNEAVKKVQKEMAGKMKEMGGLDAFKNFGM